MSWARKICPNKLSSKFIGLGKGETITYDGSNLYGHWRRHGKITMSEEAIKRRRRRAVEAAARILEKGGYQISRLRHPVYDLSAERFRDIRKIKICLDKVMASEIRAIQNTNGDAIFSREVWIYRTSPGKGAFSIKFI
jgi:hypothetical protein